MVWISIAALIAIFALSALRSINLGLLGIAAAFLVGVVGAGLTPKAVLGGFPADLFVTLVGITYLFGLARANGTIDRIVHASMQLTGNRGALMPLLVFLIAGVLTALGALGPAAVAIVAPIGLRLARDYGLSPLTMGLMTIHGAQAGAFSPISVYGGITAKVMGESGIAGDPTFLFLASLGFNALIALLVWLWMRRRPAMASDASSISAPDEAPINREQLVTLLGLTALAIGALAFRIDVGFMAVLTIVALAILIPSAHKDALKGVDWSTVLLIAGVVTYVGVLQEVGTIDSVAEAIGMVAVPLVATLLLCWLAGTVSAFASSTALLGLVVPLAAPVLGQSGLSAAAVVAAIAVSTTIVDTSPFSTNGALVVANVAEDERPELLRQLLIYSGLIVLLGPLAAWALFVASGLFS